MCPAQESVQIHYGAAQGSILSRTWSKPGAYCKLEEKITKLQQEAAKYEQEAFRARLQRDIYEKSSELIKKEAGIDLDKLTNKEKACPDQCPQRNILFENTAFRNKDSKEQLLLSD